MVEPLAREVARNSFILHRLAGLSQGTEIRWRLALQKSKPKNRQAFLIISLILGKHKMIHIFKSFVKKTENTLKYLINNC
jgi:hypothetical protein